MGVGLKTQRRLCITGMVLGALMLGGPAMGAIGTALGMHRAFAQLGSEGISDPRALASDIGLVLVATTTGVVLAVLGTIVFTLSLIFHLRLRAHAPPPLPMDMQRRAAADEIRP